jgi:hypothetical protein
MISPFKKIVKTEFGMKMKDTGTKSKNAIKPILNRLLIEIRFSSKE